MTVFELLETSPPYIFVLYVFVSSTAFKTSVFVLRNGEDLDR